MIGCLQTRVLEQPIIALHFESETELKFYNLEACTIGINPLPANAICQKTCNIF